MFRLTRGIVFQSSWYQIDPQPRSKVYSKQPRESKTFDHIKNPLQRIVEILAYIKDDSDDPKMKENMAYCIRNIQSGKLFEEQKHNAEQNELFELRTNRRGAILQMEENAWIKSCSNVFKVKRDSKAGMIVLEKVYTKTLENRLGISKRAQELFSQVEQKDFPIFDFKREVKDNELVCLSSLMLQKHNIFA